MASPLCNQPIVTDQIEWSVGLSPSEPGNNGWSDRDAVSVEDSGGPRDMPVAYNGPIQGEYCSFSTIQPSSMCLRERIAIVSAYVSNTRLSCLINVDFHQVMLF